MDISRGTFGLILLVTGLAMLITYSILLGTYVGTVAELLGVGFCFTFLGLLATVGEIVGVAPEEDR